MSTDATPSWSGYIFQGEVALCKAIETIINLGDTIPDNFCLRLEQDEDFSLKTEALEVFQVKAYLSQDANKLSRYKGVIKELIDKYHYSITLLKDPNDGRKKQSIFSINKRVKPINCSLITDKVISDYESELSSFDDRYKTIDFSKFSVIQGIYTLENITSKIDTAIESLIPEPTTHEDIRLKRNYCLNHIVELVKLRHRSKEVKPIPLNEIKKWILSSDLPINEDIFWLTIVQEFMKKLSEHIPDYDMSNPSEAELCRKMTECYETINLLGFYNIKKLIIEHINAHNIFLKNKDIRRNLASYMDFSFIYNVIAKAIEGIIQAPDYGKLIYYYNKERYQLSLISCNISDPPTNPDKRILQGYFKNIQENNLTDVDYIVTGHVTLDKSIVTDLRRNITDVPDIFSDPSINITDPTKNFGLKKLSETITDLNS